MTKNQARKSPDEGRISSWRELQLRNNRELASDALRQVQPVLSRSWVSLQGFPGTEMARSEQRLRGDKVVLMRPDQSTFQVPLRETESVQAPGGQFTAVLQKRNLYGIREIFILLIPIIPGPKIVLCLVGIHYIHVE